MILTSQSEDIPQSSLDEEGILKKVSKILPITLLRIGIFLLNHLLIPLPQTSDYNMFLLEDLIKYKAYAFLIAVFFIQLIALIAFKIRMKNSQKNQNLYKLRQAPQSQKSIHKVATIAWHLIMMANLIVLIVNAWNPVTYLVYYRFKLRLLQFVDDFYGYLILSKFLRNPVCYSKHQLYQYGIEQNYLFQYFFLAVTLGSILDVTCFMNTENKFIFIANFSLFCVYLVHWILKRIKFWEKFKYVYNSE